MARSPNVFLLVLGMAVFGCDPAAPPGDGGTLDAQPSDAQPSDARLSDARASDGSSADRDAATDAGGPVGAWREADPVVLPPPSAPPDYSDRPRTPEGDPIVSSTPGLIMVPRAEADAITARDRCAALVADCFSPGDRSMDACFRSAPRCTSARPWEESSPCCADACYERYAEARRAEVDPIGAYLGVLFETPRCMPGVDAMLGEAP